ncbi:MAG: hypothetical protein ACR2QF_10185 [Geminicoccaceae bacterium]
MTQFRLTYTRAGGHVHYAIYVRTLPTQTWAKSGEGTLEAEREWPAFYQKIGQSFQFIEEVK